MGAIDRYGTPYRLPRSYSGHNGLYDLGSSPESGDVAILVGEFGPEVIRDAFRECEVRGHLDNEVRLENEDQGTPVRVCKGRSGSWQELWPRFRRLGS